MSDFQIPFLEFVTQCFNDEYEKTFKYVSKIKPDEFEKLFMDLRNYFIDMSLVSFFNQANVSNLSKLFNNRNGDGLTVSDQVFVKFMENFTNATLVKMKLHYRTHSEACSDVYEETCVAVSTTLNEQFCKKVPFYDERYIDGVSISQSDIKELLLSNPMICFYYLVLVNLINTELYRTNLVFGDNYAMQKKRR